jgi:hypothetical protein
MEKGQTENHTEKLRLSNTNFTTNRANSVNFGLMTIFTMPSYSILKKNVIKASQ